MRVQAQATSILDGSFRLLPLPHAYTLRNFATPRIPQGPVSPPYSQAACAVSTPARVLLIGQCGCDLGPLRRARRIPSYLIILFSFHNPRRTMLLHTKPPHHGCTERSPHLASPAHTFGFGVSFAGASLLQCHAHRVRDPPLSF